MGENSAASRRIVEIVSLVSVVFIILNAFAAASSVSLAYILAKTIQKQSCPTSGHGMSPFPVSDLAKHCNCCFFVAVEEVSMEMSQFFGHNVSNGMDV